jgi:hypothetical protein
VYKRKNIQGKVQVLGYVPIQVVYLSLEIVKLGKQTYIWVASPIQVKETQEREGYNVNTVQQEGTAEQGYGYNVKTVQQEGTAEQGYTDKY